jgi:hypothetical protein
MSIDAEKLEELVRAARDCRRAGSDALKISDFWPLVEAAEALLPSLPREVKVTRWHAIDKYGNVLTTNFATEGELLNYAKHNWTSAITPVRLTGTAKVRA